MCLSKLVRRNIGRGVSGVMLQFLLKTSEHSQFYLPSGRCSWRFSEVSDFLDQKQIYFFISGSMLTSYLTTYVLDILKNSNYNTSHQRPKSTGGLENGFSRSLRWNEIVWAYARWEVVLETAHIAESLKSDTLCKGWIRKNLFLKERL